MPPWLPESVLTALITGLLALAAGISEGRRQARHTESEVQSRITEQVLETTAATYKDLSDEVHYLRDRDIEKEARIRQLERIRDLLLTREHQWQDWADSIRENWFEVRAQQDPPDYPTKKLTLED